MKGFLFLAVAALIVMEIIAVGVYRRDSLQQAEPVVEESGTAEVPLSTTLPIQELAVDDFPPPTTEVKNGVTERTIHMGVRQYAWEPAVITAKKGEVVRLIIHNADVKHGLVIPELGVNEDISPDGAVVEFAASRAGTFEFFCSVWCGEGHMEMQGKLVIE